MKILLTCEAGLGKFFEAAGTPLTENESARADIPVEEIQRVLEIARKHGQRFPCQLEAASAGRLLSVKDHSYALWDLPLASRPARGAVTSQFTNFLELDRGLVASGGEFLEE